MLNNPALDVAIGLVFIYAIYSLLATIITELFSSLINLRGYLLHQAIVRMLDEKEPKDSNGTEGKTFPKYLSEKFFEQPEIKLLYGKTIWGNLRKPSYIKYKTLAKGLFNTLMEPEIINDDTELGKIKTELNPTENAELKFIVVKKALNKDYYTHKQILRLIKEANYNVERFKSLAENWFNEVIERLGGWFKRRNQLITLGAGLLIAYSLNVNTIEIAKKLGKDEKARLEMVEAASGYISSFEAIDTLDSANYDKIEKISEDVEKLLNQSDEVQSIINISYPWCNDNDANSAWWSYIMGCLITAIALSIGSTFWFDLLSKLIKLRSAGTQEKTYNNNSSTGNPVG